MLGLRKNGDGKRRLERKIDWLIEALENSNIREWAYLIGSKKEIFFRNVLAGVSRGVGIGIRDFGCYGCVGVGAK